MVKFLSKDESISLIERLAPDAEDKRTNVISFLHESHFWRSYIIASEMVDWFGDYDLCFAQVVDWGIWPSTEDRNLYYLARLACGEASLVHEKPGHMFLKEDKDNLKSFMNMFIQFGWGVKVFIKTRENITELFMSHDGYIDVRSEQRLLHVERCLQKLEIEYRTT